MLQRDDIQALIPHQGAMCLWDEVLAWETDRIRLRARNHRDTDHPLRSRDGLHAVHLCEYGAQAMAIHGGLLARRAGSVAAPGFLVSLRAVALHVARIDDLAGEIHVVAEKLSADDASLLYAFHIEHAGRVVGEGRAMVSLGNAANP